jgi:SAM-dependent methyltransferase
VDIIILAIFNPTVYRLRYLFTKLLASEHSIEVIAPSYPYDPLNEDETFNLIVNNLLAKTDFDKSFFNTYANYGAYQLLRMALRYPGDCMEFGCYYGQSASFLAETMEVLKIDRNKRIFLFDTWEGMPSSNKAADGYYKKGDFSDTSLEKIQKTLAPWSNRFEYVKGDIVKTLPAVKPCQLCYARIDVDLYEPAKVALNTIYDWIIPGGIVYLDDYISVYTVGERIAIDEVLENYVEKPFYNVGDRAYIIKGVV